MRGRIYVDVKKCLGCKSCELHCAVVHSDSKELVHAIKESPAPQHRVRVETIEKMAVPLMCRHCDDAPCVTACPTGALEQPEEKGTVLIKRNICVGCSSCIIACPYGIIRMGVDGKAIIKCDLCIERLKAGELPACVSGCPTKAIKFVTGKEK